MSSQHGTIPNVDAGQDRHVVADPYIVADHGRSTSPAILIAWIVIQSELVKGKRRGMIGAVIPIDVKENVFGQGGVVADTDNALGFVEMVPKQDLGTITDIGMQSFFHGHFFVFFFFSKIKKKILWSVYYV
jgi:hypothetical protein